MEKVRYRFKNYFKNGVLYDTLEAFCPVCGTTIKSDAPCKCINCGTELEPNNEIKRRGQG